MAAVELDHVGKREGIGAPILSDVSLRLEEGAFYFLTGASGAGKTTLLRLITLAERASHGTLKVFGADAAALDRDAQAALRRRIGIVFQGPWLIDELSVHDNVALPLRIAGAAEREIRDNVDELLAWVGMAGRAAARTATLSGGERQRIAIARAIVHRPALLIADDPAGSGGDEIAVLLVRIFERINRLGTTVLIATDDVRFARRFEHQRFHLDHGMLSNAGAALAQ
ncbi:MAG TPA: ATP-binding cassette domain-containing protein [Stellaceae bacterium]|nr:ATP-binding cassette domain-containing protein [Stellaceae bacterium]